MIADVKRRYFKLTGSLETIAKTWRETEWVDYLARLKTFCEKNGTNDFMLQNGRIVAVKDVGQTIPGAKPSKQSEGYLEPNRRTKAGKAFSGEMCALQAPRCRPLFKVIAPDECWIVGGYLVYASLHVYGNTLITSIPRDIEGGYEPHPEMIEMKEWEFLKLKDDYQTAQAKSEAVA
jgi:hypothetical protein